MNRACPFSSNRVGSFAPTWKVQASSGSARTGGDSSRGSRRDGVRGGQSGGPGVLPDLTREVDERDNHACGAEELSDRSDRGPVHDVFGIRARVEF